MTISLESYDRVHFVGIAGAGMSALARLLLARGHHVSGSDLHPGEQGVELSQLGARISGGHQPMYVDGAQLVVITSAVGPDNPEVQTARARHIPIVKRAELLGAIVNAGRGVAVAGTHGKTTTSSLIGHIFVEAGLDPTVLVGGTSLNLGSNARVGASEYVVAEADEYDASFLHLKPEIAVITNVEPEHLDYYGSVERLHDAFREFASRTAGTLVICADDPILPDLMHDVSAQVATYGLDGGDWRATEIRERGEETTFRAVSSSYCRDYCTRLAGGHNVRNALAALVVASLVGVSPEAAARALAGFKGVARRFETVGEAAGVLVMDDYAHHPTEIRVNLRALRQRFNRPIRLVFQPHTYSRTKAFLQDFAEALREADSAFLLDIYAARERDTLGISGADLARAGQRAGADATYTETFEDTIKALLRTAQPGDLVITMGAGDVHRLGPQLLDELRRP